MNFYSQFLQRNQSGDIWQQTDHSRPSSSSSSLRSRSIDSPECSYLLYNTAITCEPDNSIEIPTNYNNKITRPLTSSISRPHQLSMQSYSQQGSVRKIRLRAPDKDDEAMTKAMVTVISSPTTSFSSYKPTQSYSGPHQPKKRYRSGAFKPYNSAPRRVIDARSASTFRGESTMKRAMAFLRRLSSMKAKTFVQQENRLPTAKQLNHIISERMRREKQNELFEVLRGLLPPGTKRDKASLLSTTIERVGVLGKQVYELNEKNKLLHRQLSGDHETSKHKAGNGAEEVEILISKVLSEGTSEEQHIGMRITVKDEVCSDITDLVICLLECLKLMNIVSLTILAAKTQLKQAALFNYVNIGLNIKTSEWDEESFKEAMTRAAYDVRKGEVAN